MRDLNAATCAAPAGEETYLLKTNKHYYGKHLCDKERQGLRRST